MSRAPLIALALISAVLLRPAAAAKADDAAKKSVVKVFTVVKPADWYQPWVMGSQYSSGGSGCILEGGRILTNAHVVSDQVYVQVLKAGDTRKYTARVEFVAHDSETALLKVDDPDFFKDTSPVRFGDLPYQRDKVAAYGFPVGGNDLSITEGVVSRIEVQGYTHSERDLLAIQTDAAINSGNSGGPVFKDGRLIGISFQSFAATGGAENIGYIVPVTLIRRFLDDVKDGAYDGVPALGIYWQSMESPALKSHYGMKSGLNGVLVTRVVYGSSAWGVLQEGDVITALDGQPVADDGTVPFRREERIGLVHPLSMRQMGETARLTVIRGAVAMDVPVKLRPGVRLVPGPEYDRRPTYFIYAGLVFTPLTRNYMNTWKWEEVLARFRHYSEEGLPSQDRRQIVILNQVLAHDANVGYHGVNQAVVVRVNGVPIAEMRDLPAAFAQPRNGFHVLELDNHASVWGADGAGTRLVLDAAQAAAANAEILERYGIPSDRSDDLKQP